MAHPKENAVHDTSWQEFYESSVVVPKYASFFCFFQMGYSTFLSLGCTKIYIGESEK